MKHSVSKGFQFPLASQRQNLKCITFLVNIDILQKTLLWHTVNAPSLMYIFCVFHMASNDNVFATLNVFRRKMSKYQNMNTFLGRFLSQFNYPLIKCFNMDCLLFINELFDVAAYT